MLGLVGAEVVWSSMIPFLVDLMQGSSVLFADSQRRKCGVGWAALGVMLLALCLGVHAGEPKLVCDGRVHEFGKQLNTSVVSHTFTLENRGSAPLVIGKIRKGCGCTTTRIESRTIPPGESVDLDVSVDLKGRVGRQKKSVYLYTNDPTNRIVRLCMSGVAQPAIKEKDKDAAAPSAIAGQPGGKPSGENRKVWPQKLALGSIASDEPTVRWISVADGLRILEVTSDNAAVHCKIDEQKPQWIHVRLEPPLPAGAFKAMIRISVGHPTTPEVLVPVTATVVARE